MVIVDRPATIGALAMAATQDMGITTWTTWPTCQAPVFAEDVYLDVMVAGCDCS